LINNSATEEKLITGGNSASQLTSNSGYEHEGGDSDSYEQIQFEAMKPF